MNIAIIPARGGSKRIPFKNIKLFHGKPIIAYSIETALKSELFDFVYVSTDNMEIQKIAKSYGAICDSLRPSELSDDKTVSDKVIKYEIQEISKKYKGINFVAEIYATAPLLTEKTLSQGISILSSQISHKYVFTATKFDFPIQRGFELINGKCFAYNKEAYNARSQDLKIYYHDAAQFYIAKYDTWLKKNFFFDENSIPIILSKDEAIDIDTLEDWKIAEAIFSYIRS